MIDIASQMGLECVEVACWPKAKAERRYAGVSHIDAVSYTHLLDFEIQPSNIREMEDVMLSFQKMRDALKKSLQEQWDAEQSRNLSLIHIYLRSGSV